MEREFASDKEVRGGSEGGCSRLKYLRKGVGDSKLVRLFSPRVGAKTCVEEGKKGMRMRERKGIVLGRKPFLLTKSKEWK